MAPKHAGPNVHRMVSSGCHIPVNAANRKTPCMHAKAKNIQNFRLIYKQKVCPEQVKNYTKALSHEGCYQSVGQIPSTSAR